MEKQYGKVERAEPNLGFIVGKYFQNFLRSMQGYWNKQTKTKETAAMKKIKFKI